MEETWTVLKVIQWTTEYFRLKDIEQPRASAELLLAHLLRMERIQLYLNYDRPLIPGELASYRELILRRASREPLQYITGKQEFWSLELEVTPDVLIPRPETELLVEEAIKLVQGSPKRVLDLGTGSGAIAIAIAHECSAVRIIGTDKSFKALLVAGRNASRHHVDDRINFVSSDLFNGFSPINALFDLIVSNPPYIDDEEFPQLAPEIVQYEPDTALLGGSQGLELVRRIIRGVPNHLKEEGSLLMEIGAGQAEILRTELSREPLVDRFEFIQDYSGVLRVLHIRFLRKGEKWTNW